MSIEASYRFECHYSFVGDDARMRNQLSQLSMEIERIKDRLVHASIADDGLSGGEVLRISQELDQLIVSYQRLMLESDKHSIGTRP